jgi:gas vesicle protein
MDHEVSNAEKTSGLAESVSIFLAGTIVGAVVAMLFAPQAGRETRKQLSEYGRRTGDTMSEWKKAVSDLIASNTRAETAPGQAESAPRNQRDEAMSKSRAHVGTH